MAQATVTPARALARLMVVAFLGVVLTLVLTINAVGVAEPGSPSGPTPAASPAPVP